MTMDKSGIYYFLGALLIATITRTNSQCLTGNDSPQAMNPSAKNLLTASKFNFSLDAFRKSAAIESKDNLFFSPHSLHEALTLAFFGARGTTEESLRRALQIPQELSKIDVQRTYSLDRAFKKVQEDLGNTSSSYELKTANRLYISNAKKVRECMIDLFGQELEKVDFKADPNAVRVKINDWVSNTTKGHIRDLIPSDGIDETSDLVLVNAVYFKGLWQSKFDRTNSKRDIFYGSKNSLVTFMRQKKTFNHIVSEELGAHVLQLPYKGEDISMFILLPPFAMARTLDLSQNVTVSGDGLRGVIERMTTTERGIQELQDILNDGMPSKEVEVSLPRFTVEKQLPVGQLLEEMGAGELLRAGADLKGFVEDAEGLHLGDAVHRAKIELNEEGTTAAAATALFSFRSSRPAEPAVFNANHPFIYLLYDKQSQSIIFTGIYRTPTTPGEA
ncbi:serine protease inhibitor 88Ea-like isoform X2 [Diachasmimorpha longicaudata]|uniref:serine protease inhibitor 88Ea-like isoform X2 n=1 Tax=Diachasmimorpha longicaudata TaxID=58733 RepID=UPI0030B8FDDE